MRSAMPHSVAKMAKVELRRAISNLIDNAVKYGGSAEVTLIAEAGQIVVAVEDRGPGIPRSKREKVFEAFYRIEDSRNPDTGGVGLGLSVARSIVREHGGDIILAARKGGGLSARFELPAWATSNEQPGSLGHQKPSCSVPSNYRSAVSLVAARLRGLLSTIPL